jgi:hypothetical protein
MLFTIAELSVALAGFSGVVVGIRGTRAGTLTRQDLFGLLHILASSGAAMIFSLLPFALHAAGVSEATAWIATSLSLGSLVLLASTAWGYATRRTVPRYPAVFWAFVATGAVLGAALLTTGSGLVGNPGGLVPITLLWLLLVGFAQFAAFLVLSWAPHD